MTIWERLGIERTKDKRKIKHAYAKQAAQYHPEEHPEEFKELYEAYQSALSYAARPASDEDTAALILEELINEEPSPQPPEREEEESRIDFSTFDKNTDALILEELINEEPSPQPSEQEEEGVTVDFSAFDKDRYDPVQMRLIDGILHNMQTIIEKPEKNIAWKIAKIIFGTVFDRQVEEWENLLASSGFQKVRNDRNFILRLNKLECVSLLSRDMAECLYKKLDFKFIEKNFERTDYQELQFRLQQCIDRDVKKKQEAERRDSRLALAGMIIMLVICGVSSVGSRLFEAQRSKMEKKEINEIQTLLKEKYHQNFKVEQSNSGEGWKYSYLCESLDTNEYEWFSGVPFWGDEAGYRCMISWKKEEGIKDSFAYELIEKYRRECDAVNDFHCDRRWDDERQHCSYQYKEDGIIYNYPIYDVWYSYEKKRAYSKEEIRQLKEWIHKVQDQDMLFAHTPYIKLLFRGLRGEEYVLKLTQNYDEVDYHELVKKLEEFRREGKVK